jgi:predicted glycogen debranching enzyme
MESAPLAFQKNILQNFDEAISKEWLVTNGSGSYASSTALGLNTRKYHGLLVAALHPPGDRTVCVAKVDEDILVDNELYRLGTNEFSNIVYPEGYRYLEQFALSPFPKYTYQFDNLTVEKTVFMPQNKNGVAVFYQINNRAASKATIKLFPLLSCRHFHTVIDQGNNPLNFTQTSSKNGFATTFQNPAAVLLGHITEGSFFEGVNWVYRLRYREEAARGEAGVDDCFQPGFFEVAVPGGAALEFALTFAVSEAQSLAKDILGKLGSSTRDVKAVYSAEVHKRGDMLTDFYRNHPNVPASDWLNWVLFAADSFMVQNQSGKKSIIAGYYWFEPWGRDTFVSLPGLTLVTGRFSDAKNILSGFMQYYREGLIPNLVDDKTGVPYYNTVDGTLWFVNAVLQYLKYTGDYNFVKRELWSNLQSLIEFHRKGTIYGIHVDSDGLLMHGPQLTWMDAEIDGDTITPRAGKAVEVQALWYNALKTMELLARKFNQPAQAEQYAAYAAQANESFNAKFWNPQIECLYDVVEENGGDASMRPNQIFAVALNFSMLDNEKAKKVVDKVNRELVTPYGLRTLSESDPRFVGHYVGNRRSRDSAYHNGTIWPWLMGPYVTANLKVNDYSEESRQIALQNLILPLLRDGLNVGGLATLNEIYDAQAPNTPRGCVSQAWSIAEPLRAYIEDVLLVKPKFGANIDVP